MRSFVVENVERQLERGLSPVNAAVAAMKEVTGPIIDNLFFGGADAVFVPVAFLPGSPAGSTISLPDDRDLGRDLGVNSLTLSPALCALCCGMARPRAFFCFAPSMPVSIACGMRYARAVRQVIAVDGWRLPCFAGAVVVTYGLYSRIPGGFLPVEDQATSSP